MTTVIVATDGSDLATQAARAGLSLTKHADEVLVASAVDLVDPVSDATGHAGPSMTYEQVTESNRQAKADARAALTATVEAVRDTGYSLEEVETRLLEGEAGPALCRLAADVGAAALIVGSRGRGGLKRAFLGSVSDYVVRNAPCPVVVSRI